MSRSIITNNPLTIDSPSITFDTTNFKLTNPPIINNSNTNLVSRNTVTGNFEVVDTSATSFATDLQNIGGFNTLVQTPGSATTHNIKTIQSTTGSIAITSAATNLDLNANVMLSNLPSGGSTVLSNPGSGGSFNFKTILASTGISVSDNVDNVFVGLNPMTPGEIGGVYGSQRATEDNRIGFKNLVPDGSKSNVIGSELPASLVGDTSNIISSYINLSTANGTFSRSNVILSGDNSEINSTVNTHVMANDFAGSGLDMESSLYIGNMRNTKPTSVSACINQNLYGNTIEMGKNSWYIGSGRNALTLAPNEMHFDTGCDRLYYHDLATGSNSNILFYDPTTGLITHENTSVLPPTPTVNIYNSNGSLTSNRTLTLGGFNLTINGIGAVTIVSSTTLTLDSSLGAVNLGTSTATSVNVGRSGISTTLGGNVFASNLTLNNVQANYLAYNSVTKQMFYGTLASLPSVNLYNTNGTLTSARTLTLGGFNLITTGMGNFDITNTGTVTIGPTSSTIIGTVGQTNTIRGNVFLSDTTQNDTFNNVLVRDNGTNQVYYRAASTLPNIYNTNGTLTSSRVVTVPAATNFTISGNATATYAVDGFQNILLNTANNVNIVGNTRLNLLSTGGMINIGQASMPLSINIGNVLNVPIVNIAGIALDLNTDNNLTITGLSTDTNTDHLLYFNNFTKRVSKAPIIKEYAIIRFLGQTSQTITSTSPQVITAGTASAISTSINTSISASRNILYSGPSRQFRITYTGNVSAAVGAQNIGVSIFINGTEMANTNKNTTVTSGETTELNTCEFIQTLGPGSLVSIGFSRSTTNTTVTFTGNLFIESLTLNPLA